MGSKETAKRALNLTAKSATPSSFCFLPSLMRDLSDHSKPIPMVPRFVIQTIHGLHPPGETHANHLS
jgi:hypothetical protein